MPIRCAPTRCSSVALDWLPSDEELCSQSTISRLENVPDTRALLRLAGTDRAVLRLVPQGPKRIVLDVDDTFDRVHGGQQPPVQRLPR